MWMSCFPLQPVETPQPEGDKYKLDEYFTSQNDREREDGTYNLVILAFLRENKDHSFTGSPVITFLENVLFALYLPNLDKEEEIELFLIENDIDTIPRNELMLLEFNEKTRSFVVDYFIALTKPAIICSTLITKTLEQVVKYVQS